jgi:protein SCO1
MFVPASLSRRPSRLVALLCSAMALAAVALAPHVASAQVSSTQLVQDVAIDQKLDAQVPLDLEFVDEQGKKVRLGDYIHDKPIILNLVYYRCPMLCTQVLNGTLRSCQALKFQLGDEYEIVSVSIDPSDTPAMAAAKKKTYVASYRRPGAEEGWHFLTGSQESIDKLANTVGYRYHYDEKSNQYAHASGIMILTPNGRVSRYLYGIDYHPSDLRLALVESSENKIGGPVDAFLLMCFHYDPATGKYGLIIHNVLRMLGVITMVLMGGFLWLMFRQERRRTAAAAKATDKGHLLDDWNLSSSPTAK